MPPPDLASIRARLAAEGKLRTPAAPPPPVTPPAAPAIPEYQSALDDLPEYVKTPAEQMIDNALDSLDIVQAYIKFCGKMVPVIGARTESIMISCPKPEHRDSNPSAWINTDKQTWYCGGCAEGGDKYDIAAHNLNFPVPGYKTSGVFPRLREAMATALGVGIVKSRISNRTFVLDADTEPVVPERLPELPGQAISLKVTGPAPSLPDLTAFKALLDEKPAKKAATKPKPPVSAPETVSKPVSEPKKTLQDALFERMIEDVSDSFVLPTLDWREIVPTGTFLHEYMTACSPDDIPEEYHFWNALVAIGQALGRNTGLSDRRMVLGNLFICTIGPSGAGKSRATWYLQDLMKKALPWEGSDPDTNGSKVVAVPGSAEVLIHSFSRQLNIDPADPKKMAPFPVKGIVEFSELSALVGRTSRVGNTLQPTLIDFYDAKAIISTSSLTNSERTAIDPFCSVISTTQLKSLRKLLSEADASSGFLNRWVFPMGQAKPRVAIGGYVVDVTPAVKPLMEISVWSGSMPLLDWSADAREAFEDFWQTEIEPARKSDQNDMLTRLDLLCKKLVLLFAANSHERLVSSATVDRVRKIFPYLIQTYHTVDQRIGFTEYHDISQAITTAIQVLSVTKPPSIREIKAHIRAHKFTDMQIVKGMEWLLKTESVEEVSIPGTGRPTIRYRYVS